MHKILMKSEQRRRKFVILLEQLLTECEGIKGSLAKKLGIKPSTLTPWLQGKIDPASLDVLTFIRIAETKQTSIDKLALFLGINFEKNSQQSEDKFKRVIKQLLSSKTQQELAQKLEISRNTIAGWINPQKNIDPSNINIGTMVGIAIENGWTVEKLLSYLGLIKSKTEPDLLFKVQSDTTILSLNEQVKLLAWLSNLVQEKVTQEKSVINKSNLTTCIIIEKEDLAIGSSYLKNLNIHTQLQLENIEIATISKLPDRIHSYNLLIFDIGSNYDTIIDCINQISFNGDIVIFTSQDLESEVRSQLQDKVTDIVVKPLDWDSLKDKPYFAGI